MNQGVQKMEYLDSKEAAQYLRISYSSLKRMRETNEGDSPRFFRPAGRKIVYRKDDLDAWVTRRLNAESESHE